MIGVCMHLKQLKHMAALHETLASLAVHTVLGDTCNMLVHTVINVHSYTNSCYQQAAKFVKSQRERKSMPVRRTLQSLTICKPFARRWTSAGASLLFLRGANCSCKSLEIAGSPNIDMTTAEGLCAHPGSLSGEVPPFSPARNLSKCHGSTLSPDLQHRY